MHCILPQNIVPTMQGSFCWTNILLSSQYFSLSGFLSDREIVISGFGSFSSGITILIYKVNNLPVTVPVLLCSGAVVVVWAGSIVISEATEANCQMQS